MISPRAAYFLNQYYQTITNKNIKIRFLLVYALAQSGQQKQAKTILNDTANSANLTAQNNTKQEECQNFEKQKFYVQAIQCYDSLLFEQLYDIKLYYTLIRIAQKIKSKEGAYNF